MAITTKKLTNAERYTWGGNGFGGSDKAASYGVFDGDQQVAVITRVSGGGYMEKAAWECRNTQPEVYTCYLTGKVCTAKPGRMVLAYDGTLKAVKEKMVARLTK